MKIPKKLKIGGHTYTVIHKNLIKGDGEGSAGKCMAYHNKIWIADDSPQSVQEQALIHEIIEAIKMMNDLGLEHKELSVIAEFLYQTLNDNNLLK